MVYHVSAYDKLEILEIKQGLSGNERGKTAPVVENNSGSWRLFTGIAGHTTSHYLTLHHTSYADNLQSIKNNSRKDSSN